MIAFIHAVAPTTYFSTAINYNCKMVMALAIGSGGKLG